MLGQIFTHWHCLQHVGTHGFCRGRRVCPTEAIKNHPEKNHPKLERTVYAKYVRSRSNIFKRRNIDQACSANMTCTSRIPVFLFFFAGDLPQSVLLVFWTEGNGSKSVHACHAIRQDFINDCHTILHEGNQQIIPTIRLIFEMTGRFFLDSSQGQEHITRHIHQRSPFFRCHLVPFWCHAAHLHGILRIALVDPLAPLPESRLWRATRRWRHCRVSENRV